MCSNVNFILLHNIDASRDGIDFGVRRFMQSTNGSRGSDNETIRAERAQSAYGANARNVQRRAKVCVVTMAPRSGRNILPKVCVVMKAPRSGRNFLPFIKKSSENYKININI